MKRSEIKALFPEATKDQIDSIMDLHGEGLESIKANYKDYVPKSDLDTITAELTALKSAPKQDLTAEQLAELETLRTYKADTEPKLIKAALETKTAALTKALEGQKANPKAIKLLLKEFDLNGVELDEKGEVKSFDELVKPVKESYGDFFGVEEIRGAVPGKAPAQTMTETDISKMSMEQYKEYRKQNNFSN